MIQLGPHLYHEINKETGNDFPSQGSHLFFRQHHQDDHLFRLVSH